MSFDHRSPSQAVLTPFINRKAVTPDERIKLLEEQLNALLQYLDCNAQHWNSQIPPHSIA